MMRGCYETSLLLFANAPGAGILLITVNYLCAAPGTHRETNAQGLPGGMLAVKIDSHISFVYRYEMNNFFLKKYNMFRQNLVIFLSLNQL